MTDEKKLPSRLVMPPPGVGGRSKWEVTEFGLSVVEELASRGCRVETIARALGMNPTAFVRCRREQSEVEEAYQQGLAREHDALVGNLRRAADEGNIVAGIFLLKARHGYREGEAAGGTNNVQVNINLPAAMSPEEYTRMIEAKPAEPDTE